MAHCLLSVAALRVDAYKNDIQISYGGENVMFPLIVRAVSLSEWTLTEPDDGG